MKLTEQDIKNLKIFHESETGRWLLDYLERLLLELFKPEDLTVENLPVKKEAREIIKRELIDRIKLINSETKTENSQYI